MATRRRFIQEYQDQAASLVLHSGRTIRDATRGIGVHEITLGKPYDIKPFYRYSDALHVARRGQCFLYLGRTADAVQAIGESLNLYAGQVAKLPSSPNGINIAMAKLDLSTARVQAGDIDEGAAVLADVGDFVSQNRADRLVKRVRGIRATLEPWQDTAAVKQLDDHLYGSGLRS